MPRLKIGSPRLHGEQRTTTGISNTARAYRICSFLLLNVKVEFNGPYNLGIRFGSTYLSVDENRGYLRRIYSRLRQTLLFWNDQNNALNASVKDSIAETFSCTMKRFFHCKTFSARICAPFLLKDGLKKMFCF